MILTFTAPFSFESRIPSICKLLVMPATTLSKSSKRTRADLFFNLKGYT